MQSSPLPEPIEERALVPPSGVNSVWQTAVPNANEPNSSLTYYVHFGSLLDPRLRVTAALLTQILSEPAFNILRTREQLGYIVSCSQWNAAGQGEAGMRVIVQSERTPAYLEERVDAFFDEILQTLKVMTEEELNEHKHGLEKRWMEDPKNTKEETNRYWYQIDSGYLDFYRRKLSLPSLDHRANVVTGQENVEILKTLTKEELIALLKSHVHYTSTSRAKLAVHLKAQKTRPKRISEAAIASFTQSLEKKGISVDEAKWREELFSSGEPALTQAAAYWQQVLASEKALSEDEVKATLQTLPKFSEEAPALSDNEGKLREGTSIIEDPESYRSTLRLTDMPQPVVEWNDLPTSKL